MLSEKTINQVKARIDNINKKLKTKAEQALSNGTSIDKALDQLTAHAIREFTPESKLLMNSVYNVLSNETLETAFFKVTAHEAAFNKRNIQADITNHFSFKVPDEIDFKKDYNELLASSGIVVIGGLVSISIKNGLGRGVVIAIAALLAYLMYKTIKENKQKNQSQLIDKYLTSIKETLVTWLENIAEYYDQQVTALKTEIEQQENR